MSTDDAQEPSQPPTPAPPKEPWGRSVQRRREAVGMTQEEIATRAGLSFSNLKGIESGHVEPTERQRNGITIILKDAEKLRRQQKRPSH